MKRVLLGLLVLALMPGSGPAWAGPGPRICAHRGFWQCKEAGNTQNSLAALRQAQEAGFWGSEFDVHLTADSVVVVNHDPTYGGLPIARTPYSRLAGLRLSNGEILPTLDQYLSQGARSGCMLVLEIKPQPTPEATLYLAECCRQLLEKHGLLDPRRVLFISFSYEACQWVAQQLPGFGVQYLKGNVEPEILHADGINGMNYHFLVLHLHPDWVQRAHNLGLEVNVWTVDSASEMRYLIDLGVDVITTNKPLLLKEMFPDPTPAEAAAAALAQRLVPQYRIEFRETADTAECYRFWSESTRLVVEGSSASALAVGLNRYLNDWCHSTVSWYAANPVEVPEVQPSVPAPVCGEALVPERFFLNYCTFGYTMPWFRWADWERLIDWMALQGVNLPLAITGQEAVWQEVWRGFGLTDEEIRACFTGPAHLPWHRMCNIDGVDGPLPQEWIDGQAALQEQILARERELGMRPVLPAFGGHVPGRLKELFPEARITDVARWCGFPEQNRCHFLAPSDPLYGRIQRTFLEAQTRRFGTDHIYGFDLFNEVPPPSWEPEVLASIGRGAYESVAAVDPEAQWLQMGWLFFNDSRHWTPENVKAYLEAVPAGKVTLLDYYTEHTPVWKQTDAFYGQPYLFCYLGNFGGNTRLAGPFREESARITEALEQGGARGIGCTLEGFGVNQWMYEYVLGRAWHTGVADDAWLAALDRRRGSPDGFWKAMADSIYLRASFSEGPLLCGRPCDEGYQLWTVAYPTPYNPAVLEGLLERLKAHPSASYAWKADVVTLECQVLGNRFAPLRDAFVAACRAGNRTEAIALGEEMKRLLLELDGLAGSLPEFRAEDWLSAAQAWGPFRDNAWHLLTVWGADAPYLNDYASRVWSGLVRAYYLPRWELFIQTHLDGLESGQAFDAQAFDQACRELELRLSAHAPVF